MQFRKTGLKKNTLRRGSLGRQRKGISTAENSWKTLKTTRVIFWRKKLYYTDELNTAATSTTSLKTDPNILQVDQITINNPADLPVLREEVDCHWQPKGRDFDCGRQCQRSCSSGEETVKALSTLYWKLWKNKKLPEEWTQCLVAGRPRSQA